MTAKVASDEVLSDEYVYTYAYRRSLGPVLGRYFGGLRDGRIHGARTRDGKVIVPANEYDTEGDAIVDLVPVGSSGVVTTWSWNATPREGQPLARPFAWALVRLDGADTAMLHAVDVPSPEHIKTGMRVRARFAAERGKGVCDIACSSRRGEMSDPIKSSPSPCGWSTRWSRAATNLSFCARSRTSGSSASAARRAIG